MTFSGEYTALPLLVGQLKSRAVLHYIYVRPHQTRDSSDGSAVFVANLPNDTTLDNVRDLCKALGGVILEDFVYQGQNRGLVRLVDEASSARFVAKARKLAASSKAYIDWSEYGPRGARAYIVRNQARFPNEDELQDSVDLYMEEFTNREEEDRLEARTAGQTVDDQGFTLVVRPKRKSLADISDVAVKRSKKSLEKKDFYRFQLREKQKHEMNALLRRYQEDKLKVEKLKQEKKLRPY